MSQKGKQLREVMDRLYDKLYALSQPLSVEDQGSTGLLPGEIQASAELMDSFVQIIEDCIKVIDNENTKARKEWPNKQDWENFIQFVRQLSYVDIDQRQRLISWCETIQRHSPGTLEEGHHRRTFLPDEEQWERFKLPVLNFHRMHIKDESKHKKNVVLWAAVYEALAQRTSLKSTFCGPDFDEFIYVYCAIPYNRSATPRGRYRRVEQIWQQCTSKDCPRNNPRLFDCYIHYLSEFTKSLP